MTDAAEKLSQLKIDRDHRSDGKSPWPWIVLVLLLVIGGGAAYWMFGPGVIQATEVKVERVRSIQNITANNSVLDASGYVIARRQATVSSETTGKVTEVLVEEGMTVEEGQVVARLDDSAQRAQLALSKARVTAAEAVLAETQAQLKQARVDLDRSQKLISEKLVSQAELDAAEANFETLAARLETGRENVLVSRRNVALAEEQLDNTVIRAPFPGVVVSKNAQPGEMISPVSAGGGFTRTGICTIVDMNSLEIEVDVNEAYIQRVTAGQRVTATLDAYPDWDIPAQVIAIVPTADRQKATVRVRIGFLERDERVLRDMGVNVAFLETEVPQRASVPGGLVISKRALQSDDQGDFVWLVVNDRVERRSVQVSQASANRAEVRIVEGLSAGERVVSEATQPLASGSAIKIQL